MKGELVCGVCRLVLYRSNKEWERGHKLEAEELVRVNAEEHPYQGLLARCPDHGSASVLGRLSDGEYVSAFDVPEA